MSSHRLQASTATANVESSLVPSTRSPSHEDEEPDAGYFIDLMFLKSSTTTTAQENTGSESSESSPDTLHHFPLPPVRLTSREGEELLEHGFLTHELPSKFLKLADDTLCKGHRVGQNGQHNLLFMMIPPQPGFDLTWTPRIVGLNENETLIFLHEEGDRMRSLVAKGVDGAAPLAQKYMILERDALARRKKLLEHHTRKNNEQVGTSDNGDDDNNNNVNRVSNAGGDAGDSGRSNTNGANNTDRADGTDEPEVVDNVNGARDDDSQLHQLLNDTDNGVIKSCILNIDPDLPFMGQWACSRLIRKSILGVILSESRANTVRSKDLSEFPVASRMPMYKHVLVPQKYDSHTKDFAYWTPPGLLWFHAYKAYRRTEERGIPNKRRNKARAEMINAVLARGDQEYGGRDIASKIGDAINELRDKKITIDAFNAEFTDGSPWSRVPQAASSPPEPSPRLPLRPRPPQEHHEPQEPQVPRATQLRESSTRTKRRSSDIPSASNAMGTPHKLQRCK
ncbi:hypothetical protein GGR53DRAFT_530629 [Hypoxylon sp. FL1150]|nr:hypothetical protein GGR53DRAFT_530629 [Hypoxylon sp. FL1150]